MSRTLITNGYVVTVDARRNVFPDGYVAIDGARISAVGPASQSPKRDTFDEVIDARGCNRAARPHQHAPAPLVHAVQGAGRRLPAGRLGDEFLLPLSHNLTAEAMRVSSALAGMEMLATGTTCSLNHSVTTTTPDLVKATIEPHARSRHPAGLRQGVALQDAG